ncbi:hypothetical protein GCM10011384_21310 [Psychrobacillus lasiicapitis]|nr:hypothetical protein GCM10011384_21310 [Psychrobacillus lasiicapitis]
MGSHNPLLKIHNSDLKSPIFPLHVYLFNHMAKLRETKQKGMILMIFVIGLGIGATLGLIVNALG